MLSTSLGSTSMITDSSSNVISETKYKACPLRLRYGMLREGETRYSSGTNPTDYTYTGQYSYTDDFGLMFYNARWYDPSLGRFAQADTIVPSGVQGLDRYAYTFNNPIIYTDPSGHMPCQSNYCDPRWASYAPESSGGLPLTQPSSEPSEVGKSGVEMRELYLFMKEERGYSPYEFLSWILLIESSGDLELYDILLGIASRSLWGSHVDANGRIDLTPKCPASICINGIFNYLGGYSESAWGRYENYLAGDYGALLQDPTNVNPENVAPLVNSGGLKLSNVNRVIYNNNTPMHYGFWSPDPAKSAPNAWWVPNMIKYFWNHPDNQIGTGAYQIVYRRDNENGSISIVFTINQAATWGSAP